MNKVLIGGIVAICLSVGIFSGVYWFNQSPAVSATTVLYPSDFRSLPKFTLNGKQGEFKESDLLGKWSLIFFGYTSCPDVCPNTLHVMQQVAENVGGQDNDMQYVMVSVDPDRDTPERLNDYTTYFNPEFLGLTAEKKILDYLTYSFGATYIIEEHEENDNYLVDHTVSIFMVNPQGKLHALFQAPHVSAEIAADIQAIKG